VTSFNVPDLRGRFPLGVASSGTGSTLAGTGGALDHTHTGPSHTHTFTSGGPSQGFQADIGGAVTQEAADQIHTHSGTTAAGGTGDTGGSNPAFSAVHYIIRT
jgi:microcystin-dependent protein